jgi:hypothetical protein
VYSRAVESGESSVLYALAVYALALAMAWLPGHALAGSSVATAVAQISPCRLTMAPHSIFPEKSPPASPSTPGAVRNHFFNSSADGRSGQLARAAPALGGPPVQIRGGARLRLGRAGGVRRLRTARGEGEDARECDNGDDPTHEIHPYWLGACGSFRVRSDLMYATSFHT